MNKSETNIKREKLIEAIMAGDRIKLLALTNPDKSVVVINTFFDLLKSTSTTWDDESSVVYFYTEEFKATWAQIEKNIAETHIKNSLINKSQT